MEKRWFNQKQNFKETTVGFIFIFCQVAIGLDN